jgi:hypothetical protein
VDDSFEGGFRVGEELIHPDFSRHLTLSDRSLPSVVLHEWPHWRQTGRKRMLVLLEGFRSL